MAIHRIAYVVSGEVFNVMKYDCAYDESGYVARLLDLIEADAQM
jgi:hypothetical protein